MIIGGFQKLSLLDFPGNIASIVFTQGCMFSCAYCHNPELVYWTGQGRIPEAEVFEFLEQNKSLIEGVCITGGEPTLQKDLYEFVAQVKAHGLRVKIDTTGINPQLLARLLADGLVDYIAMDIKHVWEKYSQVIRKGSRHAIEQCARSLEILQSSGIDHEFRTTVFPAVQSEEDLLRIAGYLKAGEKYYVQEVSYKKNLDSNIDRKKIISVSSIVRMLRQSYPSLQVFER